MGPLRAGDKSRDHLGLRTHVRGVCATVARSAKSERMTNIAPETYEGGLGVVLSGEWKRMVFFRRTRTVSRKEARCIAPDTYEGGLGVVLSGGCKGTVFSPKARTVPHKEVRWEDLVKHYTSVDPEIEEAAQTV